MSDGMTDDTFVKQKPVPGVTDGEGSRFFGKKVDDFPITPTRVFIWVQEFGQPNQSQGGIYYGEHKGTGIGEESFTKYRATDERYGRVIAVGPGYRHKDKFIPLLEPDLGDVVIFSKKHGTRFAMQYQGCWIRVIDPIQCVGVVEDFEPWWDMKECQESPDGTMTG